MSVRTWMTALLFTAAHLFFVAASTAAAPLPLKVRPAVNLSGDKRFDGLLLSEGIANLVAQEFYDTGMFTPVEEKKEISQRIRTMTGAERSMPVTAEARAEITKVGVSRIRGLLGFLGGAKTTVKTTIRVILTRRGKLPISAEATASANTKAAGAFFEVRSDRISFDATSTGRMVQQAVHDAVREIAARIKEEKQP